MLSPSEGQIAHALLTRSPLSDAQHPALLPGNVLIPIKSLGKLFSVPLAFPCRLAYRFPAGFTSFLQKHSVSSIGPFDLHVLSTPPAFVLSQDQTLQNNFILKSQIGSFKILTCFFDCSKLIDSAEACASTRTFVFGFVQFSRFLRCRRNGDLYILPLQDTSVNTYFRNTFYFFPGDLSLSRVLLYISTKHYFMQALFAMFLTVLSLNARQRCQEKRLCISVYLNLFKFL